MKLDREIAKKALTDGFCLLYGEVYRELFDSVGEEIIEFGIKNGRKHFYKQAMRGARDVGLWIQFKLFNPSERYKSIEELAFKVKGGLALFLGDKEIETLLKEVPYTSFNKSDFAFPLRKDKLFAKISDILRKTKPTPIKKITSFDYFKNFPIYDTYKKSVNLATEGGFGLDQFSYSSVKYYLEEGEEFYIAEAIPYKYHQLGSTLAREDLRCKMVDKIKKNITKDSDYWVKRILHDMVKQYCFCSEEDSTLLDIQTVCGEDGFSTVKQIDARLRKMKF